jgi:L-asparaginase
MYETSSHLKKIGVLSGSDMTYESAVTKLMFLLGQKLNNSQLKKQLISNLRGELTL